METNQAGVSGTTINQQGQTVEGNQLNIAGNYNEYKGDDEYNVQGLENPYLGLRYFDTEDSALYTGREEEIRQALAIITAPGNERVLFFVNGVSGSGKSSFARAGLIPALKNFYENQQLTVNADSMHPGQKPLASLTRALRTLKLQTIDIFQTVADYDYIPVTSERAVDEISILIIDQFEELFVQSEEVGRQQFLQLLTTLPTFLELRLHIIATLRADYLPDLYAHQSLYNIATKWSIELREMNQEQIKRVIQRPLQVIESLKGKRFQDELLTALSEDAAEDAAYLPLLQVTLIGIWDKGKLIRSNYETLTSAIRDQAERVFAERKNPDQTVEKRQPDEQAALLRIFRDLIYTARDIEHKGRYRDTRRSREMRHIAKGNRNTQMLVQELAATRLISIDKDDTDEDYVVNIIHESLIKNWDRLQKAIDQDRDLLEKRARFEVALDRWRTNGKSSTVLLDGVDLEEAKFLKSEDDVVIQDKEGKEFLDQSLAQQSKVTEEKLTQQRRTNQKLRILVALAVATTMLAVISLRSALRNAETATSARIGAEHNEKLAIASEARAEDARQQAERQLLVSRSQQLSAVANSQLLLGNSLSALQISTAAIYRITDTVEARNALRASLEGWREITTFPKQERRSDGHTERVSGIYFSRDGTLLATASTDNTARVWDLVSGTLLLHVQHDSDVTSALISFDSKYLISASRDKSLRTTLVANGQLAYSLRYEDEKGIRSLALHPNGKWVGVRITDTIYLLDIETGKPVERGTYRVQSGADARTLYFTHDGNYILSGAGDTHTHLWNIATGSYNEISIENGHQKAITSISQSRDGRYIATLSEDRILLWEWMEEPPHLKNQPLIYAGDGVVFSGNIEFSPNSKVLAVGSSNGTVRIWNLANLEEPPTQINQQSDMISGVWFSPDSRILASTSREGSILLWNLRAYSGIRLTNTQLGNYSAPVFSRDGRMLATSDEFGVLHLWRAWEGGNLGTWPLQAKSIEAVSELNSQLFVVGDQGLLERWNLLTGESKATLLGDQRLVSIDINAADKLLVVGAWSGELSVLDLNLQKLTSFQPVTQTINAVRFIPQSDLIVIATNRPELTIWNWRTKTLVKTLTGHTNSIESIALTKDGLIFSASSDGNIRSWDIATGKETGQFTAGVPLNDIALSNDSIIVAASDFNHMIHLWDTLKQTHNTLRASSNARKLRFAADGQLIAALENGTIQSWNLHSRDAVNINAHPNRWVKDIVVSSDGRLLFSAGDDGLLKVWGIANADLLQLACDRITRPLQQTEWSELFTFDIDLNYCTEIQSKSTSNLPRFAIPKPAAILTDTNQPNVYYFESTVGNVVAKGTRIQLRWHVENASAVYLEHGDARDGLAGKDKAEFTITESTTFRLIAQGKNDKAQTVLELPILVK